MRYIAACLVGFGVTCVLLWVLTPLASRVGLVDCPGKRKRHKGDVALVGGAAMFAGFTFSILALDTSFPTFSFFAASALLVIVGILDDLRPLRARIRFAAQTTAALIMILGGGVVVQDLGAITGNGTVALGAWAMPFTIFATIGVINALNMSDGVDGLAGGLSLIAFVLLAYIAMASGRVADASILILLACIVGAFLLFNLRFPWRRRALVFMGDGGSMFLGFALAWFAISLSQGEERAMMPVTALWILALPLIDTVSSLVRRILAGRSPFAPDQYHLHHMLLAAGCSVNGTVGILLGATLVLGVMGLFGLLVGIAEHILFYCFLGLFVFHLWSMLNLQEIHYKTGNNKSFVPHSSSTLHDRGARFQD